MKTRCIINPLCLIRIKTIIRNTLLLPQYKKKIIGLHIRFPLKYSLNAVFRYFSLVSQNAFQETTDWY